MKPERFTRSRCHFKEHIHIVQKQEAGKTTSSKRHGEMKFMEVEKSKRSFALNRTTAIEFSVWDT